MFIHWALALIWKDRGWMQVRMTGEDEALLPHVVHLHTCGLTVGPPPKRYQYLLCFFIISGRPGFPGRSSALPPRCNKT